MHAVHAVHAARISSRIRVRTCVTGSDLAAATALALQTNAGEDKLEHVDWEEWFDAFDSNNLALLYQEQKSSGEDSTFSKLVRRDQP